MVQGSNAKTGDVVVLVGTRKGGFILSSDAKRKSWSVSGPHWPGGDIFHMAYDRRDGAVWAAVNSPVWGSEVQRSHDLGATWVGAKDGPRFDVGRGLTMSRAWHIEPGRESEPGVVYAGVEPAALFKSTNGGDAWTEVRGLSDHETREQWQPGLGGLCLHSIVVDPVNKDRMWVGVSAVGVFGTTDGGESWETMNQGVRADFLPDRFPRFGQCPHKVLSPRTMPERLYQQNHCGVFRSDSAGENWLDITEGLPSRFGFVIGIDPHDPDIIYTLPEDSVLKDGEAGGGQRYVTDARFRVYRSRNAGADWEPLTSGLPQESSYLHVLREGITTDGLDPCGIYVGATSGQIFYSRDGGEHWELLIQHLPAINSVESGVVG